MREDSAKLEGKRHGRRRTEEGLLLFKASQPDGDTGLAIFSDHFLAFDSLDLHLDRVNITLLSFLLILALEGILLPLLVGLRMDWLVLLLNRGVSA